MLDFYTNRTMRGEGAIAPVSMLKTYRTAPAVLKQVENEIGALAASRPREALELADHLWDEGWLETRLLAAILIGRIPPQEERLLARLTAWAGQLSDPIVRAALLTTSLARLRKETPERFLDLVGEWLNPKRQRLWPHGIQALIPLIRDPNFTNLPPVFDTLEEVVTAAPVTIQSDLINLFDALYAVSPSETIYFLQHVIENSDNPMTAVTIRRILPSLPSSLADALRGLVKTRKKTGESA
ncbi:MAG: hypothetical protein HFACDABA_01911 [Anaerolineales bacterium]|nr:hypothetical protein [Anaerolineales bacterium]